MRRIAAASVVWNMWPSGSVAMPLEEHFWAGLKWCRRHQKATISETDMQFISQTFRPFVDSRVSDLTLLHVRKIVGDLNSEKAQKAGGSLAQLSSWWNGAFGLMTWSKDSWLPDCSSMLQYIAVDVITIYITYCAATLIPAVTQDADLGLAKGSQGWTMVNTWRGHRSH